MRFPLLFKAFALLLALTLFVPGGAAAALPRQVAQALRTAGIPQSSVSALVQEVGSPRASLAVNEREPRNPASVMKLVTTYAALELLGPAYRWKTEVFLDGDNVVIKGYGDPKLTYESFWTLLRNLHGRGLTEIRGNVLLDRSYFAPVPDVPFDGEAFRTYNVPPDALLVNFKALRFSFLPEDANVRVFVEPALPGLEIVNLLRLSGGGCPDGRAFRDLLQASFESSPRPRAAFTGEYPLSCGERDLNVALYSPEEYVTAMIRQLWAELGGRWKGAALEGIASPGAKLVYVHESEPLAELVRDINKFSNNVMARQLFLTLAAESMGPPAQAADATRVVKQWLTLKNIRAPELVLENGSGLSRVERISAAHLAALMQAAWASPVMAEFVSSLPLVAVDGTMRKRMLGERIAGNAHVKTGLLQDARAIAGYVLDRKGKRHVVVMIVNHPKALQADAAMDALLAWVYDSPTTPARPTSHPRGVSPRDP
jgi:D-alanyl-D-alanine carboxypeptidase/D-alanyl-D-alanine-endopeptidase (penicillin-binding protein 4)